jgi:hypothetical protein
MTLPAMTLDLTLVMASELVVVVVVVGGEWFSAVFVGNWWQRRTN